jgi:hypothetical protein
LTEKKEVRDFEDLDLRSQEAIVDLIVSIIRNAERAKQEE